MAGALLQSAEWHSQSNDCLMAENSRKWLFYPVIKCHSLPLSERQRTTAIKCHLKNPLRDLT